MITKEEFVKFITEFQSFNKAIDKIEKVLTGRSYSYTLFESDWVTSVEKMLDIFIESHFTNEGIDWICYYLFETIKDKKVTVTKEADLFKEKEEVEYHLNSITDLWDFLLTDKKLYFKNAE
jgi:hypothetical protein